jgi:hypothetical protein
VVWCARLFTQGPADAKSSRAGGRKRLLIYKYLLKFMSDEQKFMTTAKLVQVRIDEPTLLVSYHSRPRLAIVCPSGRCVEQALAATAGSFNRRHPFSRIQDVLGVIVENQMPLNESTLEAAKDALIVLSSKHIKVGPPACRDCHWDGPWQLWPPCSA